jgi:hypothetical protein
MIQTQYHQFGRDVKNIKWIENIKILKCKIFKIMSIDAYLFNHQ